MANKYISSFYIQAAYDAANVVTPNVSLIKENGRLYYNGEYQETEPLGYKYIPLTFKALENCKFRFNNAMSYSLDGGVTWMSYGANSSFNVASGGTVMWKGQLTANNGIGMFTSSGMCEVYGNVMSLVSGDSFAQATSVANKQFIDLFKGNTGLTSAENLILPATTLAASAYTQMFSGCTSLTTAPQLPATTLAASCYRAMFANCSSLTTAPVLSATTLAEYCYHDMFSNCTSLTTPPALPATTLAAQCYRSMFNGCTSMTTAPELPATTLANDCYEAMFQGCTSLTTAPVLSATSVNSMYCYLAMFNGCTNLNNITCLATSVGANTTRNWVSGVAATGTFTKAASMTGWTTGVNGIPDGWTVVDYSA